MTFIKVCNDGEVRVVSFMDDYEAVWLVAEMKCYLVAWAGMLAHGW